MKDITISVELLEAVLDGDSDAIKQVTEMLPKPEPLFDRWATHPNLGRVLCVSEKPNGGYVCITYRNAESTMGVKSTFTKLSDLDFDPLTLTTEADFKNAPDGTIVDRPDAYPHEKQDGVWWLDSADFHSYEMAEGDAWRVIRWGEHRG